MTPERIAEIAHSYADYCVESDFMRIKKGIQDAIQEAIDIVSKTWKYPQRGELPENKSKIIFYLSEPYVEDTCVGIFRNNRFLDKACAYTTWHKPGEVKCWMYTPEMPED